MRVVVLLMLVGCTQPDIVRIDEAEICVLPAQGEEPSSPPWVWGGGQPVAYAPQRRLEVFASMYYPGCMPDAKLTCAIGRADGRFVITTEASWSDGDGCVTREAHSLRASCLSAETSARTYSIEYAGEMRTLEVPSESPAPCIRPPQ